MIERIFRRISPDVGKQNTDHRENWLRDSLAAMPDGARVLDAGAGTQRYKKYCNHLNYVSQDFASYDGQGDGSGIQMGEFQYGKLDIVSDISSIPEEDSCFDVIMCVEVIEHLQDPLPAIREFSRLLKKGGILLISAPFCSLTHFAPYHFSSGFNRYWYDVHLASNGFHIESMQPNGNYYEFMAQEISRLPTVTEKYTNSHVGVLTRIASYILLRKLLKNSRNDKGSAELLCFGYEVIARKK
jgi:SAM-dependent methyltransferase